MKTDDELLERARRAGWVWLENCTDVWPGTKDYPVTGWREVNSMHNGKVEDKIAHLRGDDRAAPHRPFHCTGFNNDLDCVHCGKPVFMSYHKDKGDELLAMKECWTCNFYMNLKRRGDGVVIDRDDGQRHHYMIGPGKKGGEHQGFGGARHDILFDDGRYVQSYDLWSQGEVPKHLYDKIPVNACFVSALAGDFLSCLQPAR